MRPSHQDIMFEFFRRKRTDAPKVLYFKSNQAAFEYTCKYMNNSLLDRAAVLAVVLGGNGTFYCVKVANDNDSSIPTETPEQILDHGSIENLCFSARTIDGIPALSVGDLVMFVALPELAAMGKGTTVGTIVAKVKAAYDREEGGWLVG